MEPAFFATPAEFRAWLEEHHEGASELLVGFHKKGSGTPSITWPESVEEALCFSWIDGVRRSLGDAAYTIRFTPRRQASRWSVVNVKKAEKLIRDGRMRPAGLMAFERRNEKGSGVYSYEQRDAAKLDEESDHRFRANKKAWGFFQAQPPWYRRTAIWWVVSAKRAETLEKRLATLIEDSEHGRTIRQLTRRPKPE